MLETEEQLTVSRLQVAQSQTVRTMLSSKKCLLGSIPIPGIGWKGLMLSRWGSSPVSRGAGSYNA